MKTILGLDLGTNSIGWALVKETENSNEKSEIIKLGVRVNPLTVDEKQILKQGDPYPPMPIEQLKEVQEEIYNVINSEEKFNRLVD